MLFRSPIRNNAGIGTNINSLSAIPNGGSDYNNDFKYGATSQPLLEFIGNDLYVRRATDVFGESNGPNYGVIIANTRAADINNIFIYANDATATSAALFYPFVAAGNLVFNDNLIGDGDARYWVFYNNTPDIPGLSTSLSAAAGTVGVADGVIGDSFNVGAGVSHP